MPSYRGQGQSKDITEWKERGISAAITVNLRLFKQKFGDKSWATYQHFDLNSGCGVNEKVGCIGSPIAFLQAVDSVNITNYRAYFIDRDRSAIEKLNKNSTMDRNNCFIHFGDNKAFISAIPALIKTTDRPDMAIGSVLIDPNGADVPIDELAWLANECPKLDFIINWNSTACKRQQGNKGYLADVMSAINKSHWLIREQLTMHQFTLLIGRNMHVGDHKSLGFHHLDSERGREIFMVCNHTKEEYATIIKQSHQREMNFEI